MFVRSPSALWTELDGQFMLMNIEDGSYYEMAGIGSVIWQMLETPRSEADIIEAVLNSYQVEREQCARDVRAFLEKLVATHVVNEQPEAVCAAVRPTE
ncbi:MAG: PqqD family protein [Pseudomonadota bacterium]